MAPTSPPSGPHLNAAQLLTLDRSPSFKQWFSCRSNFPSLFCKCPSATAGCTASESCSGWRTASGCRGTEPSGHLSGALARKRPGFNPVAVTAPIVYTFRCTSKTKRFEKVLLRIMLSSRYKLWCAVNAKPPRLISHPLTLAMYFSFVKHVPTPPFTTSLPENGNQGLQLR